MVSSLKIKFLYFVVCGLYILELQGCGPGVADGVFSISDAENYYLADAGGNERIIIYKPDKLHEKLMVDARADEINVIDGHMYIARRPRTKVITKEGFLDGKLEPVCEFWQINLNDNQIVKLSNDAKVNVACKPA